MRPGAPGEAAASRPSPRASGTARAKAHLWCSALLLLAVFRELGRVDSAQISLVREPWHSHVSGTTALQVTLWTKEMWGQRCCPCPAAGLRRKKPARVKDEGWWCPGTRTAQVGASCHRPAVISVLSRCTFTPVSQSIPEKGNSRSWAALWEGECHVWSSPRPPGIPGEALGSAAPLAVVLLAPSSWGSGSLSCLGGFGLQGSPASIINRTNYLAEGRWAGGGG